MPHKCRNVFACPSLQSLLSHHCKAWSLHCGNKMRIWFPSGKVLAGSLVLTAIQIIEATEMEPTEIIRRAAARTFIMINIEIV